MKYEVTTTNGLGDGRGYEDILHLPHHVSQEHPHMPAQDRAAQFSPFAALTGYEGAIREAARRTEEQVAGEIVHEAVEDGAAEDDF